MLKGTFKELEIGQRFVKCSDFSGPGLTPIYEKTADKLARQVSGKTCAACNAIYFEPDEPVIESLSLAPTDSMLKSLTAGV